VVHETQYGPEGPIHAADEWVKAVLIEHDLRAGWPYMTEDLRRSLVEAWATANAGHPALAPYDVDALPSLLAVDDPSQHPLWGGFATGLVSEFRTQWSHINPNHCGYLSAPRPIGIDRELVLYVDKGTPDPVVVGGPEGAEVELALPHVGFVMHHGPQGWKIEGFDLEGRYAGGQRCKS
jgi:hypothetical protein